MDNDAIMLEKLGNAVTDLMVRFRASTLMDRVTLRPSMDELLGDYTSYQLKLLKEGVLTTPTDIKEMEGIRDEIDKCANTQSLLKAIVRSIAFIGARI